MKNGKCEQTNRSSIGATVLVATINNPSQPYQPIIQMSFFFIKTPIKQALRQNILDKKDNSTDQLVIIFKRSGLTPNSHS